jgi:hypothetical protein
MHPELNCISMSLKRIIHTNPIFALPCNFLHYSTHRAAAPPEASSTSGAKDDSTQKNPTEEGSALSRRFEALAEDALLSSPGRASTLAREDTNSAAISDNLKRTLADRIASAEFKYQNAQAISIANIPSSASKLTRDLASARPWTGTEFQEDAVLRMLVDATKPLKMKATPQPSSTSARTIPLAQNLIVLREWRAQGIRAWNIASPKTPISLPMTRRR